MSAPTADRPQLRIGNAERDSAFAALDTHLEAGRLDVEEYGERYGKASVARTRDELDVLFVDLPEPRPFAPAAPAVRRSRRPVLVRRAVPLLGLLPFVLIGIAVSTGAWFLFFALPFAFGVAGRHGCGPMARTRHHRSYRHPYESGPITY